MDKLRVGIIGTGGIAMLMHLPAYDKIPGVKLTAACDIVAQKAEKASKQYGIPRVYEQYSDLLNDPQVDAVSICTPNYLHAAIAVEALLKGKHVLCEKPDAISVEEALQMQAAARASGKLLMVVRNNRFRKEARYLRQFIQDGLMGDIYAAKCGWVRRRGIPGKGGWFTTKALSGGGPLIDLGVHIIDLAIWLMGNPMPVSVTGATYCHFAGNASEPDTSEAFFGESKKAGVFDVEDLAMGFVRFENGACLQLEFSWASNIEREENYVELLGTQAGARLGKTSGLKVFGESNGVIHDTTPIFVDRPGELNAHGQNIQHFVDCITRGITPIFEPQQGVDMIKILMALYESARAGKEVALV